jgi:calmodulin
MQSKAGTTVNFDSLLGFISQAKAKTIKEQDVVEALKVFDKDGNGYIKTDEVKRILSQLGEKLTSREVCRSLERCLASNISRADWTARFFAGRCYCCRGRPATLRAGAIRLLRRNGALRSNALLPREAAI